MTENKKFLESIPGFLEIISKIKTQGFFSSAETIIKTFDPDSKKQGVLFLSINGLGFIPYSMKFRSEGVDPLVNIEGVIEKCKKTIESSRTKIANHFFEVKTENWNRWSKDGEKILGTKGTKITISFYVQFK